MKQKEKCESLSVFLMKFNMGHIQCSAHTSDHYLQMFWSPVHKELVYQIGVR
jgi:hypothetical protein